LRKRPQIHDAHAPGQRLGQLRKHQHVGRTRQQEPAGAALAIDRRLDRAQQIWGSLDLVDHHPAA
jgi:hypothetical protein